MPKPIPKTSYKSIPKIYTKNLVINVNKVINNLLDKIIIKVMLNI